MYYHHKQYALKDHHVKGYTIWSHLTKCNNSIITVTLLHTKLPLTQPRQVVNNEGPAGLVVEIYISTWRPPVLDCSVMVKPTTGLLRPHYFDINTSHFSWLHYQDKKFETVCYYMYVNLTLCNTPSVSAVARLLRSWVRIGGMDVCLLWVLCVVR